MLANVRKMAKNRLTGAILTVNLAENMIFCRYKSSFRWERKLLGLKIHKGHPKKTAIYI